MKRPLSDGPLIIKAPQRVSVVRRAVMAVCTLLAWLLFAYLCWPVIESVLHHWFLVSAKAGTAPQSGVHLLSIAFMLVSILVTALFGWAMLSWMRFRGVHRRKHRSPMAFERMAEGHSIPAGQLLAWRLATRLVMHHEPNGHIAAVEQGRPLNAALKLVRGLQRFMTQKVVYLADVAAHQTAKRPLVAVREPSLLKTPRALAHRKPVPYKKAA